MRITRKILIVLAIILIGLNGISYLGDTSFTLDKNEPTVNKIAYFIGRNIGLFSAILLLLVAYIFSRAIKRKEDKQLVDSLFTESDSAKEDVDII